MISYAQNFEDVMLARVFHDQPRGLYLDVGAMHPTYHSVTKWFYERGWRGINIEPAPSYYALLVEDRPRDINLNIALGEKPGTRAFYEIRETGLSTFSPGYAEGAAAHGFVATKMPVTVRTLGEICDEHVKEQPIDFLKVDVEGAERAVLSGGDWARYRPRVVLVEATKPLSQVEDWQTWQGILTDNGYRVVYFDGLNRFYLRQEDEHLAVHFRAPPNVFDGFIQYDSYRAKEMGERLRQELDQVYRSHAWRLGRLGEIHDAIRGEVAQRRQSGRGLPPVLLQAKSNRRRAHNRTPTAGASALVDRTRYTLADFLPFDDEEFVRNAYRLLLKREADAGGLETFLTQLRTGRLSKVEVLGRIRYSNEGRTRAVRVRGLLFPLVVQSLHSIPVARSCLRWVAAVFRRPARVSGLGRQRSPLAPGLQRMHGAQSRDAGVRK